MNLKEAERIAGKLSVVGKAGGGWASTGLPALSCNRGSFLARFAGTACRKCYAKKGNYIFNNVFESQLRRLEAIEDPRWTDAMVTLISPWQHFRWFDSGDIQNLAHLDKMLKVMRRLPNTKFWLPTHEPFIIKERLDQVRRARNLCVRISADLVEDRPTTPTWGLNTSTIHRFAGEPVPAADGDRRKSLECGSHRRGNQCGPCRACWDRRVMNVSYLMH